MSCFVIGNWKMNLLQVSAQDLVKGLVDRGAVSDDRVSVVVCPPYTLLACMHDLTAQGIMLGGQNCHHASKGAFTGEISAEMLSDLGCRYVILGHSERRRDYNESDADVGHKAKHAREAGLVPVICLGETLSERQGGATFDVIERQLRGLIDAAGIDVVASSVIAYEPVWAIGTGLAATSQQAQEVHARIREVLVGRGFTSHVPLLYGGSVTADNASELFACPDIDGALVGGASLKAEEFAKIVDHARRQPA